MNRNQQLMAEHILVVDDKLPICHLISELLEDIGYETRIATSSSECLEAFRKEMPAMVILDIWLHDPSMDGLQVLDHLKRTNPEVPVVIMSGHGTIEIAVQAMQRGAADFLEKPINVGRLSNVVRNVMELIRLKRQVRFLQESRQNPAVLIGSSPPMTRLRELLDRHAATNARVMLSGPAGSGRETAARYLHSKSNRQNGPFVSTRFLHQSAEDAEARLFGVQHPSGNPEPGLLERANLGIVYLDEIGNVPLEIQPALARAVASQEICRVGGKMSIKVDFRVISSSSENLEAMCEDGRMYRGLLDRLNSVSIDIPPLSVRLSDIPELAEYMIYDLHLGQGLPNRTLDKDASDLMMSMSWPGNLRQLRNVLERALFMNKSSSVISKEDIMSSVKAPDTEMSSRDNPYIEMNLRDARTMFEREYLMAQLKRFDGNISRAAEFVRMERAALHRKLKSLGISIQIVSGSRVVDFADPDTNTG